MRRLIAPLLVVLFASSLTACSEDWVVVRIFPAFAQQDTVVPTHIERVLVEVVASLSPNEARTCTRSARQFSELENTLEFPIEVVLTPAEDRDWTLIALRVTAFYETLTDSDAVAIRTERLFRPNFEGHTTERIYLDERCHADLGGELPCAEDEQCVIGEDEVARCEPSGVQIYFDAEAEVDALCQGD